MARRNLHCSQRIQCELCSILYPGLDFPKGQSRTCPWGGSGDHGRGGGGSQWGGNCHFTVQGLPLQKARFLGPQSIVLQGRCWVGCSALSSTGCRLLRSQTSADNHVQERAPSSYPPLPAVPLCASSAHPTPAGLPCAPSAHPPPLMCPPLG